MPPAGRWRVRRGDRLRIGESSGTRLGGHLGERERERLLREIARQLGDDTSGLGKILPVVDDQQLTVLRNLADRRRSLGDDHTRMISQLHQLVLN
jgi:hypothetical protein